MRKEILLLVLKCSDMNYYYSNYNYSNCYYFFSDFFLNKNDALLYDGVNDTDMYLLYIKVHL